MQYSRRAQVSISSGNKSKISVKSLFTITAGALVLTVFLLHSTLVAAGNNTQTNEESGGRQVVLSETEYGTRVAVNREDMTVEMKTKSVTKDNTVGAFSMQDGAREGFYGDGEYAY